MAYSNNQGRSRWLRVSLKILVALSDGRVHTRRELETETGMCWRTVKRHIAALDECGFSIEEDTLDGRSMAYQLVAPEMTRRTMKFRRVA
jgi:biotin operon repressor